MSYTGYCMVHDLCTVFVFESEYRSRRSVADNMARAIESEFAYPGASFDFEAFTLESDEGQNIGEIAERAAADAVGQYAYCDSVPEYSMHPAVIRIDPIERSTARDAARDFGLPVNIVQALLDGLCASHNARDEEECARDLNMLLENMTGYYN